MSSKKGSNSAKKASDRPARSNAVTPITMSQTAAGFSEVSDPDTTAKILDAIAALSAKIEALEGAFQSTKAELISTTAELSATKKELEVKTNENRELIVAAESEIPQPAVPVDLIHKIVPATQQMSGNINYHHEACATVQPPENLATVPQPEMLSAPPPHRSAVRKLPDLPEFDGSPEQWPLFYSAFRESSLYYSCTDVENLFRLQKCLKGAAKEIVESLLIYPNNVSQIVLTLEFNFGRPELLIRHQMQKVREVSVIPENKLEHLIPFHIKVQNLVAFLSSANSQQHLSNPMLLEELVSKLPPSKQFEWAKVAFERKPCATVSDFSLWLSDVAKYVSIMSVGLTISHRSDNKTKGRVLHAQTQSQSSGTTHQCQSCGENHFISRCEKFLAAPIIDRWSLVKESRLCFSCLKRGHASAQCRSKQPCDVNGCRKRHHRLLHEVKTVKPEALNSVDSTNCIQVQSTPVPDICLQNQVDKRHLLYRIVPVIIYGPKGEKETFAFLDEGSSVTMIEQCLADEIGATGEKDLLRLQWYGNKVSEEPSLRIDVKISGRKPGSTIYPMPNVRTVKNLSLPTQTLHIEQLSSKFRHIKNLPIDEYQNAKPQILIGLEHCYLGIAQRTVVNSQSAPIAACTKLGWVVYGPADICKGNDLPRICLVQQDVDEIVKEYFSTEGFGTRPLKEEQTDKETTRALQIMKATTRRVADRYETGLIWKADNITLPDSYEMAYNRLVSVERKMKKDATYAKQYNDIIASYIHKGYARELPKFEETAVGKRTWYLPHFLVTNANKPGKYRLVFDAAAIAHGTSLNDNLLKGPDEVTNLVEILIKFRKGAFGVCGDIVEMFSQVRIQREDQDSQRFLWRYGDPSIEPRVFVMLSMIFGASCSPASAQYVKNMNAQQYIESNSRAVEAIVNRHYVDDYVDSFDTEEEAIETSMAVRNIHQNAGFVLKKFMSNSSRVLAELNDIDEGITINMDKASETATKILGMHWDPKGDVFIFKINTNKVDPRIMDEQRSVTKRELLRITMSIFDPYGFLANILIYPKRLLQDVWEINLDWDDYLPSELQSKFHHWLQSLKQLARLQVPRCYSYKIPHSNDIQLHIFVDASEEAFGAVAYLRVKNIEVDIAFVCGKSRCAPLKRLSVPRLELQAAVLGTRLKMSVQRSLNITITKTVLWSDSQTVLHWLRSGSRKYKPFVAHRIGEILESTSSSEWRWVPTKMNAADATTRSPYPIEFNPASIWLTGPDFLKRDENDWPSSDESSKVTEPIEEIRSDFILKITVEDENSTFKYLEKFSKWWRIKRVLAWVLRFVHNAKSAQKSKGELTVQELRNAENYIFKYVQLWKYSEEVASLKLNKPVDKQSSLYKLNPGLDKHDILRIFGRLDLAVQLPESQRRPIILPPQHKFVYLIIAEYHENFLHQNERTIMCEILRRFYIPRLRYVVKAVKRNCNTCKIRNAVPLTPLMGQLPVDRVTPFVRPFTFTGLDYFGPLQVTVARHREKRWVALFTCLTTRAVHLEIATDLSSGACLMCIANFVNRRGVPQRIRSDRGTNFVKAAKDINNRSYDNDEIQAALAHKNIEWLFNCPANPSAGGCWERLVQAVKRVLSHTLTNEAPKVEVLHHVLLEAENMVNSRPLTDVSMDSTESDPLTPNDFLLGVASSVQTSEPYAEFHIDIGKQYRVAEQLKTKLWKRWATEYLPTLIRREKWHEKRRPLKEGEVVIICDENMTRKKWRKGVIVKVNRGKDGQTRSAEIRTVDGTISRPASKIAVLDVESGEPYERFTGGGMSANICRQT